MLHARRQFRFLVSRLAPETKILMVAAFVVALLLSIVASRETQEHRQDVVPVNNTFGHEAGHNFAISYSEAEEARRRAARQAELDARAERASEELGVPVQPEAFALPPDPPSAAEH